MHTLLIFKNLYLNRICTIFSIYTSTALDFNSRLQKQVPVRPHFVHTTSITDDAYSTFTYIARTIRPTLRTLYILYIISSPVFQSSDSGGVRDYTVCGGKDEPVWLGVILRYQLPKLSWRRRQHDAFRSLVFWFNVIIPTTLTFLGNICCSRYAVVRLLHRVNHKLPLARLLEISIFEVRRSNRVFFKY